MTEEGDKVYVVENYLVEERIASLLAGDVGLAVVFGCYAGSRKGSRHRPQWCLGRSPEQRCKLCPARNFARGVEVDWF
jgi:hypothetical protein